MPYYKVQPHITLHYQIKGTGIPILFIHPPILSSENFRYQLKSLSSVFQVIAPDIRGHGKSTHSIEPLTYSLIVADILQLLDHLGIDRTWIAGYSTGGSVALELMLKEPERVYGGILLSAMSEVSNWALQCYIQLAIWLAKKNAINTLASGISWSNSDCWTTFQKLLSDAKGSHMKNVEQYCRYSLTYNCTDQLNQITKPVLMVYGKKDPQFYSYAKLLEKNLRHQQCKWVSEIRHQLPTKAYQTIDPWITSFIQEHS